MIDKLKEAAQRAAVLSSGEDMLITIKVRNYGFHICGQREVGEEMKRTSYMLLWEQVEQSVHNPLLSRIERIADDLQKSTP